MDLFRKIVQFLLKYYVIVWLISTLVLYLFILFTSTEIIKFPPNFSAKGLNVFIDVFKIPLYYFTANIGIYTIILTHRRIDQTQTMLDNTKEQIDVLKKQEDRNQIIFFENTFFKLLRVYNESKIWVDYNNLSNFIEKKIDVDEAEKVYDYIRNVKIVLKHLFENQGKSITIDYYLDIFVSQMNYYQKKIIKYWYDEKIDEQLLIYLRPFATDILADIK